MDLGFWILDCGVRAYALSGRATGNVKARPGRVYRCKRLRILWHRFDGCFCVHRRIQNPKAKIQNLAGSLTIAVLTALGSVSLPCRAAGTRLDIPRGASGISEARAAVAQFDAEVKLAIEAHAQNDGAALQEHQKKAQEYLKQAKRLYDEADAPRGMSRRVRGAASSDDVDILREYGTVLMKGGDFDLAAEVFQRAAKRAPGDAALWRELGRALSLLGHPRAREAVDALRHSLAIDPSSTDAPRGMSRRVRDAADTQATLGRVYRQEGLCDLARECFQKSLELNPDSVPAKMGLIGLKIQDGEMAEAADDIDKLGALPLEHAAQLPGLLSESVQHFEASRLWFPDTAENHIAYAKILFRVGRMEEALEAAERSAKLDPSLYTTWNFIGDLSLQMNRAERAREAYTRSLELKPDQPMTQERLDSLKK